MNSAELVRSGRLDEGLSALQAEIRAKPQDTPLQSPMPRNPSLDNEEPELSNEEDIPSEERTSGSDKS